MQGCSPSRSDTNAFILAMIGGGEPPTFPGLLGHDPDLGAGRRQAAAIGAAAAVLQKPLSSVREEPPSNFVLGLGATKPRHYRETSGFGRRTRA